jgi:hypothetical protein
MAPAIGVLTTWLYLEGKPLLAVLPVVAGLWFREEYVAVIPAFYLLERIILPSNTRQVPIKYLTKPLLSVCLVILGLWMLGKTNQKLVGEFRTVRQDRWFTAMLLPVIHLDKSTGIVNEWELYPHLMKAKNKTVPYGSLELDRIAKEIYLEQYAPWKRPDLHIKALLLKLNRYFFKPTPWGVEILISPSGWAGGMDLGSVQGALLALFRIGRRLLMLFTWALAIYGLMIIGREKPTLLPALLSVTVAMFAVMLASHFNEFHTIGFRPILYLMCWYGMMASPQIRPKELT